MATLSRAITGVLALAILLTLVLPVPAARAQEGSLMLPGWAHPGSAGPADLPP